MFADSNLWKEPVFLESPKHHYVEYWLPTTKQALMQHFGWLEFVMGEILVDGQEFDSDLLADGIMGSNLEAAFAAVRKFAEQNPKVARRFIQASNDLVEPFLNKIGVSRTQETVSATLAAMRAGAYLAATEEADGKAQSWGVHPALYSHFCSTDVLDDPQLPKAKELGYLAFRSGRDFDWLSQGIVPLKDAELHPFQPASPE